MKLLLFIVALALTGCATPPADLDPTIASPRTVSLGGAATERDAGCGPGVYCGDSPDNDGDPCTAQPDDPKTSDYDEGSDDVACPSPAQAVVSVGEAEITAEETLAPSVDWRTGGGSPPWPWQGG